MSNRLVIRDSFAPLLLLDGLEGGHARGGRLAFGFFVAGTTSQSPPRRPPMPINASAAASVGADATRAHFARVPARNQRAKAAVVVSACFSAGTAALHPVRRPCPGSNNPLRS